jgi:Fe2+ transport system protein FeoA
MLQLSFKSRRLGARQGAAATGATLLDLTPGEAGVLDRLELPDDDARRLMELGFIPGSPVIAALSAPGGDPRVFRVDGSEVALRRETAVHLKLRISGEGDGPRP